MSSAQNPSRSQADDDCACVFDASDSSVNVGAVNETIQSQIFNSRNFSQVRNSLEAYFSVAPPVHFDETRLGRVSHGIIYLSRSLSAEAFTGANSRYYKTMVGVLAHEYAHIKQVQYGKNRSRSQKSIELEADMLTGSYLAIAMERKLLPKTTSTLFSFVLDWSRLGDRNVKGTHGPDWERQFYVLYGFLWFFKNGDDYFRSYEHFEHLRQRDD